MSTRSGIKGLAALIALLLGIFAALTRDSEAPAPKREHHADALEAPPVPKGQSFAGRIVGVHDGDTVTVLWQQKEVRVRLFGIDAPETNPAQDYGQRAKQFASQFMHGKDVRVLVKDGRLTYGRVVGEIFVAENGSERSANAAIVEAGLAWAYRHYSDAFAAQEEAARAAKRGLWAGPNPVPPWEFRKQERSE